MELWLASRPHLLAWHYFRPIATLNPTIILHDKGSSPYTKMDVFQTRLWIRPFWFWVFRLQLCSQYLRKLAFFIQLYRCASISCTDHRHWLTGSMNWRSAISHLLCCFLLLPFLVSLVTIASLGSDWEVRFAFKTFFYFAFNLHNLLFYLTHLRTDLQSCFMGRPSHHSTMCNNPFW